MASSGSGEKIFFETDGSGPPLVLLHPFPTNHKFWQALRPSLAQRFRVLTPDIRCHGASLCGAEKVTMEQHAEDLRRLLDENRISRAIFAGVSIGGYILFEFWRRHKDRVQALVLSNTRPQADTAEGRQTRLAAVDSILQKGPAEYLDGMVPKLMGETTRRNRPDLVARAHAMMNEMSPAGIAAVLRGMAERADSVATLKTINVPVLIIGGEEDTLTPMADAELMHREISNSRLARIPFAGHYAPLEQPDIVLIELRKFLDSLPLA